MVSSTASGQKRLMEMSRPLYGARVEERSLRTRLTTVRTEPAVCYGLMALLIAALVALGLALGHFTDFYSIDGDIKFLAALSIAHHPLNPAIPYPFHRLDPSGRFTLPLTAWYNGHDYAGYSLPFEYIAALFLKLFGSAGLIAASIAATGLLLPAQFHLARLAGIRGHRGPLLLATVLATPLLFYALSFWEHAWGVALFLAGLTVLLHQARQNQPRIWVGLPAGLLYLGAILMRRDMAIPAIVSLLVLAAIYRDRRFLALVSTAGLTICLPAAAIILLHPQPLALGLTHASPGRTAIGVTPSVSKLQKLQWLTSGGYANVVLLLLTGLLMLLWRLRRRLFLPAFAVGSILLTITYGAHLLTHFGFAYDNPLAFSPLAIWALWGSIFLFRGDECRDARALSVIAVLGILAIDLLAYDSGGAQWGPRYFLFSFPLLVLLAVRAREVLLAGASGVGQENSAEAQTRSNGVRVMNYAFVTAIALGCVLQCLGVMELAAQQNLTATANARVTSLHPAIVVSRSPAIGFLAPMYPDTKLLFAPTRVDLSRLMDLLKQQGHGRLVMVCDPRGGDCDWNSFAGWRHSEVRSVPNRLSYAVFSA